MVMHAPIRDIEQEQQQVVVFYSNVVFFLRIKEESFVS